MIMRGRFSSVQAAAQRKLMIDEEPLHAIFILRSSQVARQEAHNLPNAGSSPASATKMTIGKDR